MEVFLSGILEEYEFLESVEVIFHGSIGYLKDTVYTAFLQNGKPAFTAGNSINSIYFDEEELRKLLPDPNSDGWSEPFRTGRDKKIVSVFNYPFINRDSIRGTYSSGSLRLVVSIGYFRNLINETRIWKNGYAFLASPKGTYMTYPIAELELKRNFHDVFRDKRVVTDSSLINAFMDGKSGPMVVYPPVLNYRKAWTFSTPLHDNGWLLVFTVPFSELYKDIVPLLITMSCIMILVVLAIFFLVFSIAKKVTAPLSRISRELHSFSIDVLEQKSSIRNETRALQKSLEILQERYERHKQFEAEADIKGKKFIADLKLASEIQHSIIPPTGNYSLPNSNISIHTVFRPAQYVSGDLYDFFMIDEKRLLIAMGDVSGGGIPAALFMGVAHTYIRSNASYKIAKDIVSQVNKQLCKNNTNQFFLTLFLGILDISTGRLTFCNAGHSPALFSSGNGQVRELIDQHGVPLGLFPDKEYGETAVLFERGECLILYTDGITDHINKAGEFFGIHGFISLVRQIVDKSPEGLVNRIMESVDTFGNGVLQNDDLSLMVVSNT